MWKGVLLSDRSVVRNGRSSLWEAGPGDLKAVEGSSQPEFDNCGEIEHPASVCLAHARGRGKAEELQAAWGSRDPSSVPCTCKL